MVKLESGNPPFSWREITGAAKRKKETPTQQKEGDFINTLAWERGGGADPMANQFEFWGKKKASWTAVERACTGRGGDRPWSAHRV